MSSDAAMIPQISVNKPIYIKCYLFWSPFQFYIQVKSILGLKLNELKFSVLSNSLKKYTAFFSPSLFKANDFWECVLYHVCISV